MPNMPCMCVLTRVPLHGPKSAVFFATTLTLSSVHERGWLAHGHALAVPCLFHGMPMTKTVRW